MFLDTDGFQKRKEDAMRNMEPLKIKVEVITKNRKFVGTMTTNHDDRHMEVSAQSEPGIGVIDPPLGVYRIKSTIRTPNDPLLLQAFGDHLIYFEAKSGPASQGSNRPNASFIIAVHAGNPDYKGKLYRTEGNIRVSNADLHHMVRLVHDRNNVELEIVERQIGLMEQFRHPKVSSEPVSHIPISKYLKQQIRAHENRRMLHSDYSYVGKNYGNMLLTHVLYEISTDIHHTKHDDDSDDTAHDVTSIKDNNDH